MRECTDLTQSDEAATAAGDPHGGPGEQREKPVHVLCALRPLEFCHPTDEGVGDVLGYFLIAETVHA